jgi:hypothetical protein
MTDAVLYAIADKLRTIGLKVIHDEAATGFVPGVLIANGTLRYATTAAVSDLLHEAGHLAIVPENLRALANGNLSALVRAIGDEFASERCADPDAPYSRALIQCSDPEATAWAFAFGRHCGLRPKEIIRDQDYDGTGADIRLGLEHNAYLGINGLRHAGFLARVRDYPRLNRWSQPGPDPVGGWTDREQPPTLM